MTTTEARALLKLSEVIELPNMEEMEGEEVNAKDVEGKNVVIHSCILQHGRGDKKTEVVGVRFNLEVPTNDGILEDGKRVYFISRNEFVVKQGTQLAKAASFPVLAKLHKNGRSFFWGDPS